MATRIEPLLRRNIFATEDEAIRELVREYVLRQIISLQEELKQFERKHGMNFKQFNKYLHERSVLLEKKSLPAEQLQALNVSIMQDEDDWLEWKAVCEMLENWLGLQQETDS